MASQTGSVYFASVAVLAGKQCQFELDNGTGATMRVQLTGYDSSGVEALARGFWSAS